MKNNHALEVSQLGRRWVKTDFSVGPVACARSLIGTNFVWDGCGGVVVETEAYAEHGDEACRGFFGLSASSEYVVADTRIGITKAADFKWRFLLKDSPFVSLKIRNA